MTTYLHVRPDLAEDPAFDLDAYAAAVDGEVEIRAHDATKFDRGHCSRETHGEHAAVNPLAGGRSDDETNSRAAPGSILPSAISRSRPRCSALAASSCSPAASRTPQPQRDPAAGERLAFACASLDEIESARIAAENRLDAKARDIGVPGATPAARRAAFADDAEYGPLFLRPLKIAALLRETEALAVREVEDAMRTHPLGAWVQRPENKGIGLRQAARLLAVLGDPLIRAEVADRETGAVIEPARRRRGPDELKQYAGHGDIARSRRRKGERVQFNPAAKMRLHLIAKSIEKQPRDGGGHWRGIYDAARAKYADAVAADGTPLTDKHRQNRALRIVGQELLKSLWDAALELERAA